jgi:hypothetical protein
MKRHMGLRLVNDTSTFCRFDIGPSLVIQLIVMSLIRFWGLQRDWSLPSEVSAGRSWPSANAWDDGLPNRNVASSFECVCFVRLTTLNSNMT